MIRLDTPLNAEPFLREWKSCSTPREVFKWLNSGGLHSARLSPSWMCFRRSRLFSIRFWRSPRAMPDRARNFSRPSPSTKPSPPRCSGRAIRSSTAWRGGSVPWTGPCPSRRNDGPRDCHSLRGVGVPAAEHPQVRHSLAAALEPFGQHRHGGADHRGPGDPEVERGGFHGGSCSRYRQAHCRPDRGRGDRGRAQGRDERGPPEPSHGGDGSLRLRPLRSGIFFRQERELSRRAPVGNRLPPRAQPGRGAHPVRIRHPSGGRPFPLRRHGDRGSRSHRRARRRGGFSLTWRYRPPTCWGFLPRSRR